MFIDDPIVEMYERFAYQAYDNIRNALIEERAQNENGRPILVVIGEHHKDLEQEAQSNRTTPLEDQEPALAAAVTEIASLEAAARLVGRENIAMSLEVTAEGLQRYASVIEENGGIVPENREHLPFMHTLAFAINNNIEVIPTDLGLEHRKTNEDLREQMQRDAIAAIGVSSDAPEIVIHVGGVNHISNLSGFTNDEIRQNGGNVTRDDRANPFAGIYDRVLYFNTARHTEQFLELMDDHINATVRGESRYAENPENAIQFDAPGAMNEEVESNIGEIVREAANQHNRDNYLRSESMIINANLLTPQTPKA